MIKVEHDASLRDNGLIASFADTDGVRRQMVTSPVEFDENPAELHRGPWLDQHTDEVLRELGLTGEQLTELGTLAVGPLRLPTQCGGRRARLLHRARQGAGGLRQRRRPDPRLCRPIGAVW